MGCDIHGAIEARGLTGWKFSKAIHGDRNYYAFAILAGVRNDHDIVPISNVRGLPDDADPETLAQLSDEHTQSWHSLRHLLEFDWSQKAMIGGWVSAPDYRVWSNWDRERGEGPRSYSKSVAGGNVVHLSSEDEMTAICREIRGHASDQDWKAKYASTYVHVLWGVQYSRIAREISLEIIPDMLAQAILLGGLDRIDDVRLVFDFDN